MYRASSLSCYPDALERMDRGTIVIIYGGIYSKLPSGVGLCAELAEFDNRRRLPALLAVLGDHIGENAAAHVELGGEAHETGLGGGGQIIEDAVGDIFVEMPLVAE